MPEADLTNANLAAVRPGLVIKSTEPVYKDMYDYAQILAVGRDVQCRKFVFWVCSSHRGMTTADHANFRLTYGRYVIDQPGSPLHGQPLTALLPMSDNDRQVADDIASVV